MILNETLSARSQSFLKPSEKKVKGYQMIALPKHLRSTACSEVDQGHTGTLDFTHPVMRGTTAAALPTSARLAWALAGREP